MKFIIAPDSYKGSLTANQICDIAEKAITDVFGKSEVLKLPVADGGEGTVDSLLTALNGTRITTKVHNAKMEEILADYGIFNENNAIIEMASASGLPLIKMEDRNILRSNTFGTGELVLDAIKKGVKTIYIGLGGSATNDGGIGFANAIGVKFFDKDNNEVEPFPENFMKISRVDLSEVNKDVLNTKFIIISDVKNPLLGEKGATNVFGKQKGAGEKEREILEKGLEYYIKLVEKEVDKEVKDLEGAGAAGGLGAGLLAFTNATMQSGVETVLKILDFKEKLKGTNLVITGEGRMDYQSAYGKVAFGVGQMCKEAKVPCVAIVGGLGEKAEDMFECGIESMMTTVNSAMPLETAIEKADELLYSSAVRMLRFVKVGINMCTITQ